MPEIQNLKSYAPSHMLGLIWLYLEQNCIKYILFGSLILFKPRAFHQVPLGDPSWNGLLCISLFLHCCNILPVGVSSELEKGFSICFKIIEISGSLAWALAFCITLLVWRANRDVMSLLINSIYDEVTFEYFVIFITRERIQIMWDGEKRKPVFLHDNKLQGEISKWCSSAKSSQMQLVSQGTEATVVQKSRNNL